LGGKKENLGKTNLGKSRPVSRFYASFLRKRGKKHSLQRGKKKARKEKSRKVKVKDEKKKIWSRQIREFA